MSVSSGSYLTPNGIEPDYTDVLYLYQACCNCLFQEMLQDSGYVTTKRRVLMPVGKENAQPNRRIRKALAPSWSTPGNISMPGVTDISYTGETPVWVTLTESFHKVICFSLELYISCMYRNVHLM
jgi:hypothetical protein